MKFSLAMASWRVLMSNPVYALQHVNIHKIDLLLVVLKDAKTNPNRLDKAFHLKIKCTNSNYLPKHLDGVLDPLRDIDGEHAREHVTLVVLLAVAFEQHARS